MSVIHVYELRCDGCATTFDARLPTAQATRAEAAKERWTHTQIEPVPPRQLARPVDYCPSCPPKEAANG